MPGLLLETGKKSDFWRQKKLFLGDPKMQNKWWKMQKKWFFNYFSKGLDVFLPVASAQV